MRMLELGITSAEDYIKEISSNRDEPGKLFKTLDVPFSMFFRNLADFAILERYVLPSLFDRHSAASGSTIRMWSAGCAEGQEPYSLIILAEELRQRQEFTTPLLVIATDISDQSLRNAHKGEYEEMMLQNVRFSHLKYFTKPANVYRILPEIKQKVEFSKYDLLDSNTTSPPSGIFGGFDLVCCCNLLIYYKSSIQQMIIKKLFNSMNYGGILLVDESERLIVKQSGLFNSFTEFSNLFIKK